MQNIENAFEIRRPVTQNYRVTHTHTHTHMTAISSLDGKGKPKICKRYTHKKGIQARH